VFEVTWAPSGHRVMLDEPKHSRSDFVEQTWATNAIMISVAPQWKLQLQQGHTAKAGSLGQCQSVASGTHLLENVEDSFEFLGIRREPWVLTQLPKLRAVCVGKDKGQLEAGDDLNQLTHPLGSHRDESTRHNHVVLQTSWFLEHATGLHAHLLLGHILDLVGLD
jgi:hypothetical protein